MTSYGALPDTCPEGVWLITTASGTQHLLVRLVSEQRRCTRRIGRAIGVRGSWRHLREVVVSTDRAQRGVPARVGERACVYDTDDEWVDTTRVERIERLPIETWAEAEALGDRLLDEHPEAEDWG